MPELPEVETITRALAPRLAGRRILSAEFRCLRVLRGDPDETASRLAGKKIVSVRRRGKFIVMELAGGEFFTVHLGMTGRLLMDGESGRHTHAVLTLDRGTLLYDDMRQFGRLELSPAMPARLAKLGPEPLEISLEEFAARLRGRKTRIKALLLNQGFVRGVGNIYADEALFRARIHPAAFAGRLRGQRIERLHRAVIEVLEEAIESRGSSVANYVDADGRKGSFQLKHNVYQRTGEPCVVCSTPIRRILIAQRGTHYCPKCQRI
ncbi:MAG: bifunctional DNA-formamidopyrimidine glycosylase/DNA-(apurinic or apyrimidinic site) lyase [Acidobacteria bacterium]|nr:bifunctional DNA-formamidopyrimidine glycosylase/DNA-(apurinic or apyrimidinic site) lyase [Acidobacteriota bacterium]